MITRIFTALILLAASKPALSGTDFDKLAEDYVNQWISVYPSAAFSQGLKSAAPKFEHFTNESVEAWLEVNANTAKRLSDLKSGLSGEDKIDARVLLRQTRLEQERWQQDRAHERQPQWYSDLVSQALTYTLVRDGLSATEKLDAVTARLIGVQALCELAMRQLVTGTAFQTQRAVQTLESTAKFYRTEVARLTYDPGYPERSEAISRLTSETAESMEKLAQYLSKDILKSDTLPDVLGHESYARKLRIYADVNITPEQLASLALTEIDTVRKLMVQRAQEWHKTTHGNAAPRESALVSALEAMEDNREGNRGDFLTLFTTLTQRSEQFLVDKNIATVPKPTTLYVGLSPDHFSGAAVGGVYPAGVFAPQFNTLFYLPSVPDNLPAQQIEDFYRSFNNHFNTMIIAHEMFPGHYLQYKVATLHASSLRTLFADDIYVEGWGSFSERLMLDAGWGGNTPLDRLAHLRKRLENATRAYSSVMVHTQGWNQEQLSEFATTRGLVPPQFSRNLWNRVMGNPLQLITYFLGFHGFSELWDATKAGQGSQFSTRHFVDSILRSGPIPIDALNPALPQ